MEEQKIQTMEEYKIKKLPIKKLKIHEVYNMLQDLRHLVIFDLRPNKEFETNFIRGAYQLSLDNVDLQNFEALPEIITFLQKKDSTAAEYEKKYESKKIRRIIFVLQGKEIHPNLHLFAIAIKEILNFDKLMVLEDGLTEFCEKYPFLCINQTIISDKNQENEQKILYSFSKFPIEILAGKLFIGNIFNSNSQKQLKDLKIKTIIEFKLYDNPDLIAEFKKMEFNYLNIGLNTKNQVEIEFSEIFEEIEKSINDNNFPVLLCCEENQFSPIFAIYYCMRKLKQNVNIASLFVLQKQGNVQLCKWCYSQLLAYKTKQK